MVSNSSSSKSTGKRPSTIDENFDVGKRRAIVSDLAALNGVSKVGLAKTLKMLNDRGVLKDALSASTSEKSYARAVKGAIEHDAFTELTDYGPLVNHLEMPTVDKPPPPKSKISFNFT